MTQRMYSDHVFEILSAIRDILVEYEVMDAAKYAALPDEATRIGCLWGSLQGLVYLAHQQLDETRWRWTHAGASGGERRQGEDRGEGREEGGEVQDRPAGGRGRVSDDGGGVESGRQEDGGDQP